MKAWIFQGKPERYPLQKKLEEGYQEIWLVTRYRDKMSKDDIVFFWSSGDRNIRGIYGWGAISEDKPRHYVNFGYGIEVIYKVRFVNHIPISKIQETGILNKNLILKMPVGTNFELTEKETREVIALIKECGEIAPSLTREGRDNE